MGCFRVWGRVVLVCCFALHRQSASASGPWDGSWYLDAQLSSWSPVLQMSQASNGTWTIFDGDVVFKAVADGQVHRQSSSANEVRTLQPDARTLVIARGVHGREYDYETLTLSPDGKTLTSDRRRLGWDGKERQSSTRYMRLSGASGLEGAWQPAHDATGEQPASPQPVLPNAAPARPAWVIWTGADGTMTWFIPNTGETLRGKADRRLRRIQGPLHDGTYFRWRQTSPSRLEFTAYVDGRPEEFAVETLSADGKTFTDTLWAAGHEDSRRISVFHKQP